MTSARERAIRDDEPTPRGNSARSVNWYGSGIGHAVNRIEELEEWQDRAMCVLLASRRQTHRCRRIIAGLRKAVVVLADSRGPDGLICNDELHERANAIRAEARARRATR